MAIKYGLTIENQNLIIEKAKTRKDGVYSFRGVSFLVKNHKVMYLAENGVIVQPYGHFNVRVGTYETRYPDSQTSKEALKKILNQSK
jgi:hypothetical protein